MLLLVFKALFTDICYWQVQIKIVMLMKIGHNCVAEKHKKTDQSLETSSEINFEFIKFVKS